MKPWPAIAAVAACTFPGPVTARGVADIDGEWIVTGVTLAPISAVDLREARALLHQRVRIAPDRIRFAGRLCTAPTRTVRADGDGQLIAIRCANRAIIPDFRIGRAGVTASLDGATYALARRE